MKASQLIEPLGRTAYRLSLHAGRPVLPGQATVWSYADGKHTCYRFEDGSDLIVTYGVVNDRPWPYYAWSGGPGYAESDVPDETVH